MGPEEGSWKNLRTALEPFLRPRDEATYIRRVLALHLGSCLKHDVIHSPLALMEPHHGVNLSPEARGLHEEYLEALRAYIAARAEHSQIAQEARNVPAHSPASNKARTTGDLLEGHILALEQQRKQEKLRAIEEHLDLLGDKPAAASRFLEPDVVFRGLHLLPTVPAEVVEGLVQQQETGGDFINRLEKQVLRARLLLQGEEQLLQNVKLRVTPNLSGVNQANKVQALSATRNELISWIEAELARAGDGSEYGTQDPASETSDKERHLVQKHLADIQKKYAKYSATRGALLHLIEEQLQSAVVPQETQETHDRAAAALRPAPNPHLLLPYISHLLTVAHEQKGLISHKSHLNTVLTRQLKNTCQTIEHLAEESHLLPRYPMSAKSRPRQGFGEALARSESLSPPCALQPWAFAADSAKIATLENVAEKIEKGQISLESSAKVLREVDHLLGVKVTPDPEERRPTVTVDDIWLNDDQLGSQRGPQRKHGNQSTRPQEIQDIWSTLDGNLGLPQSVDSSP
ncbi:hypothetical protein VTK73DRAFT_1238 [Phialemonium thermophilum]|uniref:Uncharacterized protein n=1 Tax=Phialemonium thermophilum TaxID=223376 RepID=A0ABR3Y4F3_9PEZI